MPNWTHAGFNVSGDRAELARFRNMMIKPMSDVGMEAYADMPSPSRTERPVPGTPEGDRLTLDFNGIIPMPPESVCPAWEAWAAEHWGTKWNAQDVNVRVTNPDEIWFQFSTAWDFPTPVFEALADEFPTLVFSGSAYWEEGEEYVGEFNGEDSWGPGKIEWITIGDEEGDEDEGAPDPAAPA